MARVEELRKAGAKNIFLRPAPTGRRDLARAVKDASKAKLDLLTSTAPAAAFGHTPADD